MASRLRRGFGMAPSVPLVARFEAHAVEPRWFPLDAPRRQNPRGSRRSVRSPGDPSVVRRLEWVQVGGSAVVLFAMEACSGSGRAHVGRIARARAVHLRRPRGDGARQIALVGGNDPGASALHAVRTCSSTRARSASRADRPHPPEVGGPVARSGVLGRCVSAGSASNRPRECARRCGRACRCRARAC